MSHEEELDPKFPDPNSQDKFGNPANVNVGLEGLIAAYKTNQSDNTGREKWRFGLEIVALLAVAASTAFSGYQAVLSRTSTEAARIAAVAAGNAVYESQRANDLGRQNLVFSQESFRKDHRAYVGPVGFAKPAGIQDFVQSGKAPAFDCVVKNFGSTPALKTKGVIAWTAFEKGKKFEPKYGPMPFQSVSVLYPTIETHITAAHTPPVAINDTDIAELKAGSMAIYVYGEITYETFSEKHRTTFCYQLDPDLKRMLLCGNDYNYSD